MSFKGLFFTSAIFVISLGSLISQYDIQIVNPVIGNDGSIRIWLGSNTNPHWAGPFDITVAMVPNLLFPFLEVRIEIVCLKL
jgi:hypothetical protein